MSGKRPWPAKKSNNSRNNITVNGAPSVVLYLSTRTDPRQEVEMEAKRKAGGKITEVQYLLALAQTGSGE